MTTRTSLSDPLRLDRLPIERGQIAMTICPGKIGPSQTGAAWRRDLGADIDQIRSCGVAIVVTLMESEEMDFYQVRDLGDAVRRRGLEWIHFPFPDRGVPSDVQNAQWTHVSGSIHEALDDGKTVLIHCLGGLGRTGTVAAMILQDRGADASEAISRVRSVRSGAVETPGQEGFLAAYMNWRAQ